MKAVQFYGLRDLRLEEMEIPVPREGEILVEIKAALTCGTDFKAFRQGHPVLLGERLPAPFGHEFSGVIAEVGPGVTKFKSGERVVCANSAPCGRCSFCAQGETNLCDHLTLLNGAYAQYIRVPKSIVEHNTYVIPEGVAFETAALCEPFSCVTRAFDLLDLKAGQHLAVLGCGWMGGIFVHLAKTHGIQVTALGRSEDKLEQAKILGADQVLSILGRSDFIATARSYTPDSRGFDAVVEAIGKPQTWSQAVDLARKGGSICLYGGCAKGEIFSLDAHRVHYQELKVFGAFHHTPKHFARAFEYLSHQKIRTDLLIRGEVALEALPFHFVKQADKPFVKTAVRMGCL